MRLRKVEGMTAQVPTVFLLNAMMGSVDFCCDGFWGNAHTLWINVAENRGGPKEVRSLYLALHGPGLQMRPLSWADSFNKQS